MDMNFCHLLVTADDQYVTYSVQLLFRAILSECGQTCYYISCWCGEDCYCSCCRAVCVRADRETMMARAGGGPGTGQQFDDGQAGLVYNEGR